MKKIALVLLCLIYNIQVKAQNLNSEIGFSVGITSMQTDYGERGHFASSYANVGFGVGAAYYLSFNNNRIKWNDRSKFAQEHLRLRLEVSFMQTKLVHRGKYTQGSGSNIIKYNAMIGTSTIINYGAQLEYNIFILSSKQYFDPYLSIGFLGNSNSPKLTSSLGEINGNNNLIPSVYNNGVFLDKNNSTSLIIGLGTRLRPKNYWNKSIYLIDFRWQKFNSDIVDGLKPNLKANKFNDWLLYLSIGYIFNFN